MMDESLTVLELDLSDHRARGVFAGSNIDTIVREGAEARIGAAERGAAGKSDGGVGGAVVAAVGDGTDYV